MISVIKDVKVKERTFVAEDYKGACAYFKNVTLKNDAVKDGFGFTDTQITVAPELSVERLFCVERRFFVFDKNRNLYECTAAGATLLKSFDGDCSNACGVVVGGMVEPFLYGAGGGYLVDSGVTTDGAVAACVHKGRLYTAADRTVTFGAPFDFKENAVDFSVGGTLGVSASAGEVRGLFPLGERVFVICANAVYRLTPSEEMEDFKFERMALRISDVNGKSLASSGQECVFLSANELCVFNGSSVKRIDSTVDFSSYFVSQACFDGDSYYLSLNNADGLGFIYRFNIQDESESIVETGVATVAQGGYTLKDGVIVKMSATPFSADRERKYVTRAIDFNDCREKTLCRVQTKLGADCTLTVRGDFGRKTYSLYGGYCALTVHLKSHAFTLEFSGYDQGFAIEKLSLVYRLKGE